MSNTNDEELARSREIGTIAHSVIGRLAAVSLAPELDQVRSAINRELSQFASMEAKAHRQNLRGLVHSYFWHSLPPAAFMLSAAEQRLETGRVDLVWFDIDDQILVDELKAGHPRALQLATTREQVRRYTTELVDTWGDRFLGVRLVSLAEPSASLFVGPGCPPVSLAETEYVRRGM